jgi:hypothetical protein
MKLIVWLFVLAATAAFVYCLVGWRRRRARLKRAAEERFAAMMAEAMVQARKKTRAKT